MQMTLTGSGFGSQPDDIILNFPQSGHHIEVYQNFATWTDTHITFTVPNGLDQPADVYVEQNGQQSNAISFTVQPPVFVATTGIMNSQCYSGAATELQNEHQEWHKGSSADRSQL